VFSFLYFLLVQLLKTLSMTVLQEQLIAFMRSKGAYKHALWQSVLLMSRTYHDLL
jgi:hypothetical protein